jgi:hypothetical protein
MLSEELNISETSCHEILHEDLGKKKLNARLIPYSLTKQQKEDCSAICATLLTLQARITHSALPSSLKMKHGTYSTTHKQKYIKCRVERHELNCLNEILCPTFASKNNVERFYQLWS